MDKPNAIMTESMQHPNLTAALAAAQAEYPRIEKKSPNPHFKSKYADLADGMDPVRPILAKHGIAYTQIFCVMDGQLILRTKLMFGADVEVSDLPINQPPNPQHFIATTTYYKRVALFSILGITPADEDDDGNTATQAANDGRGRQQPYQNRQPPTPAPRDNSPPARKPGRSPEDEVVDALANQGLRQQDEHDPLDIAGANEREAFSALKRAMTKADAAEADHLWNTYRATIDAMPFQGKQVLEALLVGKIKQQAAEPVA